jgi:hypothetical protein
MSHSDSRESDVKRAWTDKEIAEYYFVQVENKPEFYTCRSCETDSGNKKEYKQAAKSGQRNLAQHVKTVHSKDYEEVLTVAYKKPGPRTLLHTFAPTKSFPRTSDKGRNLYGWLDRIIAGNYPFSFVSQDQCSATQWYGIHQQN